MNNHIDNLEWVTMEENINHANKSGLMDWVKKSVTLLNTETGEVTSFSSLADASIFIGYNRGYLSGKMRKHKELPPPYKIINT